MGLLDNDARCRITPSSLHRARTSHSHGIRLYGSAAQRVVSSAPFLRLVAGFSGAAAHLEDACYAFSVSVTTCRHAACVSEDSTDADGKSPRAGAARGRD